MQLVLEGEHESTPWLKVYGGGGDLEVAHVTVEVQFKVQFTLHPYPKP